MNFLREHTVDTAIAVIYNDLAIFRLTAWKHKKRKAADPDSGTGKGGGIA